MRKVSGMYIVKRAVIRTPRMNLIMACFNLFPALPGSSCCFTVRCCVSLRNGFSGELIHCSMDELMLESCCSAWIFRFCEEHYWQDDHMSSAQDSSLLRIGFSTIEDQFQTRCKNDSDYATSVNNTGLIQCSNCTADVESLAKLCTSAG